MSRRPALFTQADLARVFCAAKRAGMAVRVDLVRGTAEVLPTERVQAITTPDVQAPVEPKRVIVM